VAKVRVFLECLEFIGVGLGFAALTGTGELIDQRTANRCRTEKDQANQAGDEVFAELQEARRSGACARTRWRSRGWEAVMRP
jgi:hypothetical protein